MAGSTERVRAQTVFSLSEEETVELGRATSRGLRGGELVLLVGDLGLGKTVFARGMALGLGIAAEEVSSPSFTLIQEYGGGRLTLRMLRRRRRDGGRGLDIVDALADGWSIDTGPLGTTVAVRLSIAGPA